MTIHVCIDIFAGMNIAQVKQIPLDEFLQRLGHTPARSRENQLWYLSPFRSESDPSFKVNPEINAWYDFGHGKGGDIIALVTELYGINSVPEVLTKISEVVGGKRPQVVFKKSSPALPRDPSLELIDLIPIRSRALLNYLIGRSIDPDLVRDKVFEARYRKDESTYFSIAFPNDSGGYELRNSHFKGTLGRKDLSLIPGNENHVIMFEGFFDYLSYLMLCSESLTATVIVLNSTSMREKAATLLKDRCPAAVELYRDNDPTGEQLRDYLTHTLPDIAWTDAAIRYQGYNDLNEWHVSQSISPISCLSA